MRSGKKVTTACGDVGIMLSAPVKIQVISIVHESYLTFLTNPLPDLPAAHDYAKN